MSQRQAWDDFATTSRFGHMYQCLWWAEPLAMYGVQIRALGCWKDDRLVGGALFRSVAVPLTGARVTECAGGPIFSEWDVAWSDAFVAGIAELARQARSLEVVIQGCPRDDVRRGVVGALGRAGLNVALSPAGSEAILDLQRTSLEGLAGQFKGTTRSGLKKGQKRVAQVRRLTAPDDLRRAYEVWTATAARRGFSEIRPWPAMEPVLRHCVDHGLGSVLAGFANNTMIAAIFVAHVGGTARWIYSGQTDDGSYYNSTHVLVFEAIRECLQKAMSGCSFGPLLSADVSHGVDQFKLGFGAVPRPTPETITWARRPLAARLFRYLQQSLIGQTLHAWVRRRMMSRGAGTRHWPRRASAV